MSGLSKLTAGIFLPLCCCTGWGSVEEGASRHAFTLANRFSAQWQKLALGLRFRWVASSSAWVTARDECMSGLWSALRYFVRTVSSCLLSAYSTSSGTWHHIGLGRMRSSWKIEKKSGLSYQLLILSGGPYSPNLKLFSVHLKVLFFPSQYFSAFIWVYWRIRVQANNWEFRERFCLLF